MDKNDKILRNLDVNDKAVIGGVPFSYFGWEGGDAFSFEIMANGYWLSSEVIYHYMVEHLNNNDIVDACIYPLFFNSRHFVELYLKFLYFKYGDKDTESRIEYLDKGHHLVELWNDLLPYLRKGKRHVGSKVNIDAIESYVKQLSQFDSESMNMRYPVDKDLNKNKEIFRLDFVYFFNCMQELSNALQQLNCDISDQMETKATQDEVDIYMTYVDKFRDQINEYLQLLRQESAKQSNTLEITNIDDLDLQPSPISTFIEHCDSNLRILLNNLFFAGRAVNEHSVQLDTNMCARQKEFVAFCKELLKLEHLQFGKYTEIEQINIIGKEPTTLYTNTLKALDILDLKG